MCGLRRKEITFSKPLAHLLPQDMDLEMVELGQCQLAHIPLDAGCGPESVEKQEFRWEIGTKRRMGEGWGRRLNGAGSKPHSTSSLFLGWIPPSPKGYCEDDESQKASSWSDVASDLGWILWALEWNRPGFESSSVIPKDGGAWWAAVYGVTHSRTQLKRLSSSCYSLAVWPFWSPLSSLHFSFPIYNMGKRVYTSPIWCNVIC